MSKPYNEQIIKVPRFKESAGFYTTEKRSKHMAKIKGKNTKPEMMFRKALYKEGVKYRIDFKKLPGKPDVSNMSKKFVVFIDGEFWHGYNWQNKKERIKSNRDFWIPKIERNIQRDNQNNEKLKDMGYMVFRFWEHQIKNNLDLCIGQVLDYIKSS